MRAARAVRAHLAQDHRYAHVLRVARFGAALAFAHGFDPLPARLAGLYHDLARLYSSEDLLAGCAERAMAIDDFERANPVVLHARLGAELAADQFGVKDEAILSAIRNHTVAAAAMRPLDVIVYLADALEPGRAYPERAAYAEIAQRDLAGAMHVVLQSTIVYLRDRKLAIAPQTLAAAATFAAAPIDREKTPA